VSRRQAGAAEERTSRAAPMLGEHVRAIGHRKALVALCAGLGLLLGTVVLPDALPSRASYRATIRLEVAQLVSDTIVREQPQFKSEEAGGGGNALQDVVLADQVLDRLGGLAKGLTAKDVVNALTTSPIPGSTYVDLTYTDSDRTRSARLVTAYAKAWASRRNAFDGRRLRAAMRDLDRKEAELRDVVARLEAETATTEVRKAELNQAQARLDVLIGLRNRMVKQQLFLGPPTAVLRTPVVVQLGAPTARAQVVALGLLVGLLVGMGLALLAGAVRPKVLAPVDVERATRLHVLASVPPGGMRGGLPVLQRPSSPAAEGFRRAAAALERRGLGDDVRILAVVSADRREGRTTLAANLAHVLARQGRDVVLVSADLRRRGLDELTRLGGHPGLAEWLEGEWNELPLRVVADHLLALPAGSVRRNPGELLTAERLRPCLQHVARTGHVVVIDTPPALASAEAMALTALADASLLAVRAGASRWRAIEHLAEALRRDGVQQVGTVVLGERGRSFARLLEPAR
jgi:Mrp family chromosome partitioning ATPase